MAEVSASQVDPFQALATYQSVTFNDNDQESPDNTSSQSSRSLAIIDESSQPILDAAPNVKKAPFEIIVSTLSAKDVGDTKIRTTTTIPEQKILPSINDHFRQALSEITPEAVLTGIAGDPHLSSYQYPAEQSPISIDKWIISTGDADMPYQCGYEGCGKKFTRIQTLTSHIVIHTSDSRFRCYFGDCAGVIRYCHREELTRHIHVHHAFERPYPCEDCGMRFRRSDHLKSHRRKVHFIEDEKSSPKRKKK